MDLTVKQIIENYLRDNGYTSLSCDDCECYVDDIMPCDKDICIVLDCMAGR